MITVILKGHGRIEHRINGIYRSTLNEMPAVGEPVRIVIDALNLELDAIVCEVNESARRFDISLLENPHEINQLIRSICNEENLPVELELVR